MCYRQNHEIIVMVFPDIKTVTLIFSCICYVARSFANVSSDSDDDNLKEALVLVEILKTEYIKALRENVAGIDREDRNNTIIEEQPTGVPTTVKEKFNLSTQTSPQDLNTSATQYHMTASPTFSYYGQNMHRPNNSFRRINPRDYYNYYDQRLNSRYEGPWRYNPIFNSRRKNQGVTTTSAGLTVTATSKSSTMMKNLSNASFVPNSIITGNSTATLYLTKPYIGNKSKLKLANIPIYQEAIADPVKHQVAAELASEIGNSNKPKFLNDSKRRTNTIRIPTRSTKRNIKTKYYSIIDYAKTTIRIHLERSTRYPIPFPENHAYCFTNPKSALCRTQI